MITNAVNSTLILTTLPYTRFKVENNYNDRVGFFSTVCPQMRPANYTALQSNEVVSDEVVACTLDRLRLYTYHKDSIHTISF